MITGTRHDDNDLYNATMNISNENTMQLRPHQLEALDKMNTKRLGQVIVPTGGGKTMCMIEDAKRDSHRIVYQRLLL